jgi:hypothetical protein
MALAFAAEPPDSGCIDVAASTIVGNVVTAFPRRTYPYPTGGKWWWHYFIITGANGEIVTFDIAQADNINGISASVRHMVWAYSVNGPWFPFDSQTFPGSPARISCVNSAAFTQDTVHVAYYPVMTWAMIEADVATWKNHAYVDPVPSADANCVIGTTAERSNGFGRTCPAANLYGFKINDPAETGPKNIGLITCGNHPGEHIAAWTFKALITFLLSSDPDAIYLRRAWTFYVYPSLNPQGRYGGLYRNYPDSLGDDANRIWNVNNSGTLVTTRTAIDADLSTVHLFLDVHGYNFDYGGGTNFRHTALAENVGATAGPLARSHPAWEDALQVEQSDFVLIEFPVVTGNINQWVESTFDVSSSLKVSNTPESSSWTGYTVMTGYEEFGNDIARALAAATENGIFPNGPAAAVGTDRVWTYGINLAFERVWADGIGTDPQDPVEVVPVPRRARGLHRGVLVGISHRV